MNRLKLRVTLVIVGAFLTILPAHALASEGSINPSGDFDGNGIVDARDAQQALRCAVGLSIPTPEQTIRSDIGPLLRGVANPDGKIDITDAILILRKAVDPAFTW